TTSSSSSSSISSSSRLSSVVSSSSSTSSSSSSSSRPSTSPPSTLFPLCGGSLYSSCANANFQFQCQGAYVYSSADGKYYQCVWNRRICQRGSQCQL
ncbi:MAG: hypothetical protein V1703_01825, partial [Candidatus Altiarchaeota archaeon]